jgi:hypothetical protein
MARNLFTDLLIGGLCEMVNVGIKEYGRDQKNQNSPDGAGKDLSGSQTVKCSEGSVQP